MRKKYIRLLSFWLSVFTFLSFPSIAQFSGYYAPVNWGFFHISGGNGTVNANGAPNSIIFTGPDNTPGASYTYYRIVMPNAGVVSFNWSVTHYDSGLDDFGYSVNSVRTLITSNSGTGTVNVLVSMGDTFAFYGYSHDGCCGTFDATISNFLAPAAGPCIVPPIAGNATVSTASPCFGQSVILNLTGNTAGIGQTYQWESSAASSGPWTAVDTAKPSSFQTIAATSTSYYRAKVKCGTDSAYSVSVQVTVPAAFPGGIYTIDSTQPQSATNFQSVSAAIAAIQCGISGPVVFNVANNVSAYNEPFHLSYVGNSSAVNTIIFNGNGARLRYTGTTSSEPAIVKLNGAKHVTINDFVIDGYTTNSGLYQWAMWLTNNADSNVISNNLIVLDTNTTSINHNGIIISGGTSPTQSGSNCDGNIIANNTIKGGYYALTMNGTSTTTRISNNQVINNVIRDFYAYGVYATYSNSTLVDNNDISRPTRTSVTTFGPIYFSTGNSSFTITRNRVHSAAGGAPTASFTAYGVYTASSTSTAGNESIVANNIFYHFQGEGGHYGIYNSNTGHIRYYHNSVAFDQTSGGSGLTRGFHQVTNPGGTNTIEFKNNNISITRSNTGVAYAIYKSTAATSILSDNNNFFVSGGGTNHIGYSGSNQTTLSAWQTTSGQDANSHTIDPMYASTLMGDLTPTNAMLDNLGGVTSITTDILNNLRNVVTPDIGAYEFSVPPCQGTPAAGTVAGPAMVCANSNFTLALTGFTIGSGISVQWEESPSGAGFWIPVTGATGTTYTVAGGIAFPTDFRAVVTCANGGGFDVSNAVSVLLNDFYLCYCGPATGVSLNSTTTNYLTNVTILNGSLNNTTTAAGAAGYSLFYPVTATNTDTLMQGQQYTINTTHLYTGYYSYAWIDYDQSGTFDSSEYIPLTVNAYTGAATFIVPLTAIPGPTGLRIRTYWTTIGYNQACAAGMSYETEDYVIDILTAPQCAGTPAGGTASAPATVCANANFNLGLTGSTIGLGITVQWEASPSGAGIWTPITGATNQLYTVTGGIASPTDFRATVTCANGGGFNLSNTITVGLSPFYVCYCGPATGVNLNSSTTNYLTNVNIPGTTLNNTTTATTSDAYNLFFPVTATTSGSLMQGMQYTLNATHMYTYYFSTAWIDYDQSGTFDSSEAVVLTTASNGSSQNATASFTVPITALPGTTGLRVRTYWTNPTPLEACTANNSYETEDYVLEILAAPPCAGTPNAGTAFAPDSVCANAAFTLQDTAYTVASGITIQWEYNTGSGWAPLAGATTTSYTVSSGITTPTDYRMTMICANSSQASNSNVISIGINPFFKCYCTSGATSEYDGELFNVTVGSLNNSSVCAYGTTSLSPSYANYTHLPPPGLGQGAVIPVSFSAGSCGGSYSGHLKVFIDYNQDGDFNDPGEEAFVSGQFTYSPGGTPVNGNITVPLTASLGLTGMRVIMMETTSPGSITPCASYSYGETEDYTVNITLPPTCLPVLGLTVGATLFNSATVSWNQSSSNPGIGYEWIIVPQGSTPSVTPVASGLENPGDTIANAAGLSASTNYTMFVRAICSSSDSSTWMNVNFTTPCSTFTASFVESFNASGMPNCWVASATGNSGWQFSQGSGPAYGVAGSTDHTGNSGYFAWVDGSYVTTQSVTLTTPVIDISVLTLPSLRYFMKSYNSNTAGNNRLIVEALNGSSWIRVDSVQQNFANGNWHQRYVTLSGVSSSTTQLRFVFTGLDGNPSGFSAFYNDILLDDIHLESFNPLSVKLEDIKATNVGSRNRIDWFTGNEEPGDLFEVERSVDGRSFTYLATIRAKGEAATYTYWDESPVTGKNFYRLRMAEGSGNSIYSKVVEAVVPYGGFAVEVFPNPASDQLTVKAYGATDKNATVTITDATGKVLKVVSMDNGMVQIDLTGMAQGMYLIRYTDNTHSRTIKVNKL